MANTKALIFYSWQSDLPNATNRGFIERALENAAKAVRADDSLQIEPVIDRDTIGVPGSPDIASTILEKIERAQIFVCDVSIISESGAKRPTPNPNVLIELGYALKALGPKGVLLLLNDAFGAPELLPFDLRMRRVIRYNMPDDATDRASERKRVEAVLAEALRTILAGVPSPPSEEMIAPSRLDRIRTVIETNRPDQAARVRTYMTELAQDITRAAPPTFANSPQEEWDDAFLRALADALGLVTEFAQVSRASAEMHAAEAARALYKGMENVLDLYTPPNEFRGNYNRLDFDFAKFLGHELFVTLFVFLLQDEQWELIAELLGQTFYVRPDDFASRTALPYTHVSQPVRIFELRKQRLGSNRLSLHADLLNERHTQGELGELVPIEAFAEADYFLYLRAQLPPETAPKWPIWLPWSTLSLHEVPRYLVDATSTRFANNLLPVFGVKDIPTFRERLAQRALGYQQLWSPLGFVRNPFAGFDTDRIGSA